MTDKDKKNRDDRRKKMNKEKPKRPGNAKKKSRDFDRNYNNKDIVTKVSGRVTKLKTQPKTNLNNLISSEEKRKEVQRIRLYKIYKQIEELEKWIGKNNTEEISKLIDIEIRSILDSKLEIRKPRAWLYHQKLDEKFKSLYPILVKNILKSMVKAISRKGLETLLGQNMLAIKAILTIINSHYLDIIDEIYMLYRGLKKRPYGAPFDHAKYIETRKQKLIELAIKKVIRRIIDNAPKEEFKMSSTVNSTMYNHFEGSISQFEKIFVKNNEEKTKSLWKDLNKRYVVIIIGIVAMWYIITRTSNIG